MKQFKAEWQGEGSVGETLVNTILHILTQHNGLCDYLEERLGEKCNCPHCCWDVIEGRPEPAPCIRQTKTITIPKPEWMKDKVECLTTRHIRQQGYKEALSDASKASGITYKLED